MATANKWWNCLGNFCKKNNENNVVPPVLKLQENIEQCINYSNYVDIVYDPSRVKILTIDFEYPSNSEDAQVIKAANMRVNTAVEKITHETILNAVLNAAQASKNNQQRRVEIAPYTFATYASLISKDGKVMVRKDENSRVHEVPLMLQTIKNYYTMLRDFINASIAEYNKSESKKQLFCYPNYIPLYNNLPPTINKPRLPSVKNTISNYTTVEAITPATHRPTLPRIINVSFRGRLKSLLQAVPTDYELFNSTVFNPNQMTREYNIYPGIPILSLLFSLVLLKTNATKYQNILLQQPIFLKNMKVTLKGLQNSAIGTGLMKNQIMLWMDILFNTIFMLPLSSDIWTVNTKIILDDYHKCKLTLFGYLLKVFLSNKELMFGHKLDICLLYYCMIYTDPSKDQMYWNLKSVQNRYPNNIDEEYKLNMELNMKTDLANNHYKYIAYGFRNIGFFNQGYTYTFKDVITACKSLEGRTYTKSEVEANLLNKINWRIDGVEESVKQEFNNAVLRLHDEGKLQKLMLYWTSVNTISNNSEYEVTYYDITRAQRSVNEKVASGDKIVPLKLLARTQTCFKLLKLPFVYNKGQKLEKAWKDGELYKMLNDSLKEYSLILKENGSRGGTPLRYRQNIESQTLKPLTQNKISKTKKVIQLGNIKRIIYRDQNKKEYVKYKKQLITVKDFRKICQRKSS